jgi:hypothetical protein
MYYPKSQIVTNKYTNGQEFVLISNNQEYIGYYWETSDSKFYTGKTPNDINVVELKKFTTTDPLLLSNQNVVSYNNILSNDTYNILKQVDNKKVLLTPIYYQSQPTQQDYQIGEFRRYFVKKINEILYIEVSKDTFENIINRNPQWLYQYYTAFNIPWTISGDESTIAQTNKRIVGITMQRLDLPKFNLYLRDDYTKFYK